MKFDWTMQCMLDFHGDLFPSRKHCLNHLFCAYGTGYEWENGELINHDYDEILKRWKPSGKLKKAKEDPDRASFFWEYTLPRKMRLSRDKLHEEYKFWYPLSKDSSPIFNCPADIKPDWLEGVRECFQALREDGIEVNMEEEVFSWMVSQKQC